MEKKGDLLNQLAIISDLIEKMNLKSVSSTVVLELSDVEFDKTYDYIIKKQGNKQSKSPKTFTITLGMVDIIFNKSSDGKARTS